jgi:hypothetical protein
MLGVQAVGLLKVFSLERELGDRGLGQEQRGQVVMPQKKHVVRLAVRAHDA